MESISDPLKDVMLNYLPARDVINFSMMNKTYAKWMKGDEIWFSLLKRDFPKYVAIKENVKQVYENHHIFEQKCQAVKNCFESWSGEKVIVIRKEIDDVVFAIWLTPLELNSLDFA